MQIRTETEIDAPPAAVWRVLTDFARYPEWNPFIVSIGGELSPGARLALVTSEPESNRERAFGARLQRVVEERELAWLAHRGMKGLLDAEHYLLLEPREGGRTRLVHGQNTTGILLRFLLASVTRETRGLVYMNQALKRRAENGR